MKLILAVISKKDASKAIQELMRGSFSVTNIASTGGFLKRATTTLLIGAHAERVPFAIEILKKTCKSRRYELTKSMAKTFMQPLTQPDTQIAPPHEVIAGGATVFVLNIEQDLKL